MAKIFRNSGDPDQTLHSTASDLAFTLFGVKRTKEQKKQKEQKNNKRTKEQKSLHMHLILGLKSKMEPQCQEFYKKKKKKKNV